eukprot:1888583-Amphidinium_carterae.2
MDTGLTKTYEDDWKNASLPQQRVSKLWTGGTRFYVLEEYKPYAAKAVGTTEPTQELSTEEETVPTTRNDPRAYACDSAEVQGRITQRTSTTRGIDQRIASYLQEEKLKNSSENDDSAATCYTARSGSDAGCSKQLYEFGTHGDPIVTQKHGWHKTRIETCAIEATHEGKPVKQIFPGLKTWILAVEVEDFHAAAVTIEEKDLEVEAMSAFATTGDSSL